MSGPWDFYQTPEPAQTAGTIYDKPIMRPLFRWGGPQVPSGENALAASQKQDAVWEQTPGSPYNLREQLKPWQQGVVNFLETPGGQATMFLANVLGPGGGPKAPVGGIRAYHGSPVERIETFKTPAFFSERESIARSYKHDGGGGDNLNGAYRASDPSYGTASVAVDQAGGDRALASNRLRARAAEQFRSAVLGLSQSPDWALDMGAMSNRAAEYLDRGGSHGSMTEVLLSPPTYTATAGASEASEIAKAISGGHSVMRFPVSDYLVALNQSGIQEILRRYGLAGMMAGLGGAAANQADAKP